MVFHEIILLIVVFSLILTFISMCLDNKKFKDDIIMHLDKSIKEQNEWLFKSLYTIDSNVKKPDDKKPLHKRKAEIYNPKKDGLTEFKGKVDDFS